MMATEPTPTKAQQELLDRIVEAFPDGEKFSVTRYPHLFITNRKGVRVDTHGVKLVTFDRLYELGLFRRVGWDNIGTWMVMSDGD